MSTPPKKGNLICSGVPIYLYGRTSGLVRCKELFVDGVDWCKVRTEVDKKDGRLEDMLGSAAGRFENLA
jgi:hypothetical protein